MMDDEAQESKATLMDQIPAGYRLYARAAEINARLEIKRQEAKIREEEQVASMFQPQLVTKIRKPKTTLSPDDAAQEKAFVRLYESSKLKQKRDVARKQESEIQNLKNSDKQSYITPNRANALYERNVAKKQARDKKVVELEASLTPTFVPQLVTEESATRSKSRAKSRPKSRAKSRGRNRESVENRLYSPNYLKERDEKLKQMKEKVETESCTFTPTLKALPIKNNDTSASKPQSMEENNPAWNRLYERAKIQPKPNSILQDSDFTFKPDISKSQKQLSAANVNENGGKVYDRLYRNHELKNLKVAKYIPSTDEEELTFKPVINSTKVPNDLTRDERIENLYQKGMKSVGEKRSKSQLKERKSEKKNEEEELTFQPKTNWGRSTRILGDAAVTSRSVVNDSISKEIESLDDAISDLKVDLSLEQNESTQDQDNEASDNSPVLATSTSDTPDSLEKLPLDSKENDKDEMY